jgi:hypothetical protein
VSLFSIWCRGRSFISFSINPGKSVRTSFTALRIDFLIHQVLLLLFADTDEEEEEEEEEEGVVSDTFVVAYICR